MNFNEARGIFDEALARVERARKTDDDALTLFIELNKAHLGAPTVAVRELALKNLEIVRGWVEQRRRDLEPRV